MRLYIVSVFLLSLLFMPVVLASEMYVFPSPELNNIGERATIEIRIANMSNIYGFQVKISYNASVITFDNLTITQTLGVFDDIECSQYNTSVLGSIGTIDNIACVRIINGTINASADGVAIIKINFTSNSIGEAFINLTEAIVADYSDNPTNLVKSVSNGSIKVSLPSVIEVTYSKYDGETTNLSQVDLSNIPNLILEKTTAGKIIFKGPVSFTDDANLDAYTDIKNGVVFIDTSMLPDLNMSAEIVLYNINVKRDIILMDGEPCPGDICHFISYENGTYRFNVTHFTEYRVTGRCYEGTYYGECLPAKPFYCEEGEVVSNCSVCGCPSGYMCSNNACVPASSGSGGGGRGSGSYGVGRPPARDSLGKIDGSASLESPDFEKTIENVQKDVVTLDESFVLVGKKCNPGETKRCGVNRGICKTGIMVCGQDGVWGKCTGYIGPQKEKCGDGIDNNCNGETDENCAGASNCFNGIKDNGEEGIDCGGPCISCEMRSYFFIGAVAALILVLIGTGVFGIKKIIGKEDTELEQIEREIRKAAESMKDASQIQEHAEDKSGAASFEEASTQKTNAEDANASYPKEPSSALSDSADEKKKEENQP